MVALLALLPAFALWLPQGVWKIIDAAVGVIQAFIFALLTILYFAFAATVEDHGPATDQSTTDAADPQGAPHVHA